MTPVSVPAVIVSIPASERRAITVPAVMAWIVSVPRPPSTASKPSVVPETWKVSLPAAAESVSSPARR
jgi:hypothetical protein